MKAPFYIFKILYSVGTFIALYKDKEEIQEQVDERNGGDE